MEDAARVEPLVEKSDEKSSSEELDPGIWDIPLSDNIRYFMNIDKYNSTVYYFAQTRFHNYFYDFLERKIDTSHNLDENCIVGGQGIGKSSTTIYYVLTRIRKGIRNVHYIDLNLVKGEMQMRKLNEYVREMNPSDVLILDHVNLFNQGIVDNVESFVPTRRIIYIETGFSASLKGYKSGFLIGNEWALSRDEVIKIWMESMKKADYSLDLENQHRFITELYESCKDRFILTPRLLRRMYVFFVIDGDKFSTNDEEGKDVEYFLMRYRSSLGWEIKEFELKLSEMMECGTQQEKLRCSEFLLHTKVMLNQIKATGSKLLKIDRNSLFKIPVNIFKCSYGIVKENESRFLEMGFQKGDRYVLVSLSVPELIEHWQRLFPFDIQTIFDNKDGISVQHILDICFQSEAVRKEVENEIVKLQYQLGKLIVPVDITDTSETHCDVSDTLSSWTLRQCDTVAIKNLADITYMRPTLSTLNKIATAKLKFQGHDRNVEKLAYLLKEEIQKNKERCLIVHPAIDNMKGLDYIVYISTESPSTFGAKKAQKPKQQGMKILHLVQVAIDVTHSGVSVGEALKVFKSVMNGLLPLHVTFIIARKESDTYTLIGNMNFENASVINMTHFAVGNLISQSNLLSKFVNMVNSYKCVD